MKNSEKFVKYKNGTYFSQRSMLWDRFFKNNFIMNESQDNFVAKISQTVVLLPKDVTEFFKSFC